MSCSTFATDPSGFDPSIEAKINNHPCYSEGAHHHYARIHVPVAPACNIQCHYCNRKYDCSNESRPGVTSGRLNPEDAVKKILYIGSHIKQLSVVGIAGPGDALANPKKTFETLELCQKHAPDLKLCISTNGLSLPSYVDELHRVGVDHITVTINTVNPEIGAKIYPWIYDTKSKKRYTGVEGAQMLLNRQLKGIELCVQKGILIKANSVLIPGVNDEDLVNVSKKLKEMGVFLHNIMPLLSEPEFGTYYGLNGQRSASDQEVMKAQEECGMDMNLMTHCRQCRADAVGLIGEDRGDEFNDDTFMKYSLEELKEMYEKANRGDFQANIEMFRDALKVANEKVKKEKNQLSSTGETILVAVTSKGEGLINAHFGDAQEFLVYEAGDLGAKFRMHRKLQKSYCMGSDNCSSDNPIEEIKEKLKDVTILMTEMIGQCPMDSLKEINLICNQEHGQKPIEASVLTAAQEYFASKKELEAN